MRAIFGPRLARSGPPLSYSSARSIAPPHGPDQRRRSRPRRPPPLRRQVTDNGVHLDIATSAKIAINLF